MNIPSLTVPEIFCRWLIVSLLTMAILIITVHGLTTGSKFMLMIPVYVSLAILLINRINWWFILVVGLFYSWIYIPSFPTSFSLFHLMAASMIPVLLACRCLRTPAFKSSHWLRFFAYAYLTVVIATIYFQGFGIRFLGGETWGGAPYIHLLIMIPFFLLIDPIQLSQRQWRLTLILYFAAGLIPSTAEIVFLLSKGSIIFPYYFIRPEGSSAISSLSIIFQEQTGVLRFQVSKYIAMLFVLCLALFPYRGKYKITIALSCLLGFSFAGLSGHRTTALYLLLLIPVLMFFTTAKAPVRLLICYGSALFLLVLALHIFGRSLPLAFQRAFSWVPFADISSEAKLSAMGTTMWRLEIWKRLFEYIPQYWLVGRGFAFDANDLYSLRHSSQPSIEWAIITHNYHNGPLSMLIDLGIFGLLFGSGIMILGTVRHYRLLCANWVNETLARYHRVLFASFCVDVFIFYAIHGDASYSIISFLVQVAMMDGIYRTNQWMIREKKPSPSQNYGSNRLVSA